MKNKFSLWLVLMCLCLTVQAGVIENLLPKPQQIIAKGGNFRVGNVKLTTPVWQEEWKNFIAEAGGAVVDKSAREIVVKMVPQIEGAELNQEEAYRLVVSGKSIQVEATTEKGVYWAMQTLRQLEQQKGRYQACEIVDWPAFKIRGFMHDIGRSYLPMDELKKEIEILSRYKINVFHWHLTENQAWRLESKIFPMLNDSVNMTRLQGKYYTIEQAKEIGRAHV